MSDLTQNDDAIANEDPIKDQETIAHKMDETWTKPKRFAQWLAVHLVANLIVFAFGTMITKATYCVLSSFLWYRVGLLSAKDKF